MKNLILLLLLLGLADSIFTQQRLETEIPSGIKQVTVFQKGAQVTREAKADLAKGTTYLKFTGISPHIDKRSVQVKGEGDFEVLSVNHQVNYFEEPEKTEQIEDLEKQKEEGEEKLQELYTELEALNEEESLILSNKSIGGQQNGVPIQELKAAADFFRARLLEIKMNKLTINRKIKNLGEIQQKIELQLKELNSELGKYTSEVVVAVSAEKTVSGKFILSYVAANAGWFPNYDIRVKDVKSDMDLLYKAVVYQTSGEDWKQVKLTLSTGNPKESGTKPELEPWRLRFGNAYTYLEGNTSGITVRGSRSDATNYYVDGVRVGVNQIQGKVFDSETGEPLIGASILVKGTTTGTSTDVDGNFTLDIPPGASNIVISYTGFQSEEIPIASSNMNIGMEQGVQLDEAVVTGYSISSQRKRKPQKKLNPTRSVATETIRNTTTVEFEIELPYSIPSDGRQYTVNIQEFDVPAYYEYFCAPKIDPDAFLTANVTDWEELNLLSGEANLFFEGTFIGRSWLDVENVADTLVFSLGRDKEIVVERTRIKEFSKKQFIGNKKTESRGWEIEVRNAKKQPVNLVIEDQFPVSTDDDIEVKKEVPEGGEVNDDLGKITWRMNLEPSESRKMSFQYSVKYPKKKRVILE